MVAMLLFALVGYVAFGPLGLLAGLLGLIVDLMIIPP